jgi:hypothetical protein
VLHRDNFKTRALKICLPLISNRTLRSPFPPHRNRSADDFLPVAIALKEQLVSISVQLNNATTRLASARNTPEGRQAFDLLEAKLFLLGQTTEDIKTRLNQIYQQWLQSSPHR